MSNSNLEVNELSELNNLTKFRLDEINKVKDYLNAEVKERKDVIKKFSKYIVAFDYADKIFITLSASFGTLSIVSDKQLLSKYNKRIRFLLCVIDIFSKYAWVISLKDKKGVNIATAFQIILKQSNRKPNKILVGKGSEFYNAFFKKWLQDNDIVMYSTNNEGKSVVAESL